MPNAKPFNTLFVWWHSKVLSRIISLHQQETDKTRWNTEHSIKKKPPLIPWKYDANPKVKPKAPIEENKGHGLSETKWKECCCEQTIFLIKNNLKIFK